MTGALRSLALVGVVGLSLLASACSGSSGAKVAQLGAATTSASSTKGDARAYSACMRSHGVTDFPDPDKNGRITITGGTFSGQGGAAMAAPRVMKAAQACQKLLPNGGRLTAAQEANDQEMFLKFAQCMRSHGVAKFPDPKPGGGLTIGAKAGVDPDTPQFKAAQRACRKVVPGMPVAQQPASPTP